MDEKCVDIYELNRQYLEVQVEYCRLVCGPFRSWLSRKHSQPGSDTPVVESPDSRLSELAVEICRDRMREIAAAAERLGSPIPFEKLSAEHKLDEDERTILLLLFIGQLRGWEPSGLSLLKSLRTPSGNPLEKARLLAPAGKLVKADLIQRDCGYHTATLLRDDFSITDKAFWPIAGVADWEALEKQPSDSPKTDSSLCLRESRITFDRLVLPPDIQGRIDEVIWRCTAGTEAFKQYGLEQKITYGRGTTILFYGPPGTGKTATAEAIAARLGKRLAVVKYDQVQNLYVGESEKKLVSVFKSAREADSVLLFDEAESLFGRRLDEFRAIDRHHNGLTNVLMQEVENYEGLVILTTNRKTAMDEAFERRLALRLEFPEPGPEQRSQIWKCLLADCEQLGPDVSFDELGAGYAIVGGKIKNAVQRAVIAAARQEKPVTMAMLVRAAEDEAGREVVTRRVGF